MCLDFVRASSKQVYTTSPTSSLNGAGTSFFCWIRPDSGSGDYTVMDLGDSADFRYRDRTYIEWKQSTGALYFLWASNAADVDHTTTATISAGSWGSVGYSFAGTSDHRMFVDGTRENDTAYAAAATGVDRLSLGVRYTSSSATNFFDGLIAIPTFWDTTLTDEEHTALSNGVHPLRVRPMNIISHWPLDRINGTMTYNDLFQNNNLTQANSPARFTDPGIYHPISPRVSSMRRA